MKQAPSRGGEGRVGPLVRELLLEFRDLPVSALGVVIVLVAVDHVLLLLLGRRPSRRQAGYARKGYPYQIRIRLWHPLQGRADGLHQKRLPRIGIREYRHRTRGVHQWHAGRVVLVVLGRFVEFERLQRQPQGVREARDRLLVMQVDDFTTKSNALEEEHFRDKIRLGSCRDSVRVVKTFRTRIAEVRARNKKPPVAYERILKQASERSLSELAVALDSTPDDVRMIE